MTILQPGQQLGPYQIISQIGKGGMATVYKAYHAAMDRYVALKVVAIGLAEDPNFLRRFQQEARLIARLEHPHILPVHDFGEADGIPYLVMRYLEAGTLKERLAASPLSLPEIDRIFTQLADALTYAHENGVVHRDIKPSNAMLDRRGDIFLTDFGVAKIVEGSSQLTATGAITGTPAYMSPEQAQGQRADQRSDIYSLGIVLFEMLTGRVPFEAETPLAVIFKHIQEPPPPLSVVRPDLPYMLEPVLLRALAKSTAERFASMHEFLDAWKRAYHEALTWQPAPAATPVTPPDAPLPAPVLAAPIPSSETATLPSVPNKPAPVSSPKFNWKPIGVGAAVLLMLLVAIFTLTPRQQTQNPPTATPASTPLPVQETAASRPTVAALAPTENVTFTKSSWTNWTGANGIYSLTTLGDKIYTAGVGGLTIWNKTDGKATQISTRSGLPSAWAVAIFRDPQDDSLWIGTDAGLAHYQNGQVSEVFSSKDGLDGDYVTAIARLGDKLLIGTTYCGGVGCGLQTYDGKRWEAVEGFPSAEHPTEKSVSYNINSLVVDTGQQIWVGTGDGIAYRDTEQKWHVFKTSSGLTANDILRLFLDKNGSLWAGTASGGLVRFNRETQKFETEINLTDYGISDVRGLAMDQDGSLWVGGYNLAHYDPATKKVTVFSLDDGSLPGRNIHALFMDENNTLFIGTEGSGLLRYDGEFTGWSIPNTIDYANYKSIVPAPDGRIFFNEIYGNGTDVYDPKTDTWAWLTGQPEGGIPMALGADGTLWYGGGNGVWGVNASDTIHLTTEHGLPSNQVNQILVSPDGSIYAATDEGLAVIRNFQVEKSFRPGQADFMAGRLGPIYVASDNTLLIADQDGRTVGRYAPEKGKWAWTDIAATLGVEPVAITSFAEDSDGGLLVGTYGNGLYRAVKGTWKRFLVTDSGIQIPYENIRHIGIAPDGAVWLADYWEGVVRIDETSWTKYSMADGLGSNIVNDIYFAPDGSIWFATDSGVTRLD